jgi:hypothetical protein
LRVNVSEPKLLKPEDKVECPHCGEILDAAADYVVQGKVGWESEGDGSPNQCGSCDGKFRAIREKSGDIVIEGIEEEEEDEDDEE